MKKTVPKRGERRKDHRDEEGIGLRQWYKKGVQGPQVTLSGGGISGVQAYN